MSAAPLRRSARIAALNAAKAVPAPIDEAADFKKSMKNMLNAYSKLTHHRKAILKYIFVMTANKHFRIQDYDPRVLEALVYEAYMTRPCLWDEVSDVWVNVLRVEGALKKARNNYA